MRLLKTADGLLEKAKIDNRHPWMWVMGTDTMSKLRMECRELTNVLDLQEDMFLGLPVTYDADNPIEFTLLYYFDMGEAEYDKRP